jgi:antitoxin VapB
MLACGISTMIHAPAAVAGATWQSAAIVRRWPPLRNVIAERYASCAEFNPTAVNSRPLCAGRATARERMNSFARDVWTSDTTGNRRAPGTWATLYRRDWTKPTSLAYAERMADSELPSRYVKLFRNGRNQAVRIPREFELPGEDAIMRKDGSCLIIEPVSPRSLVALLRTLSPLGEDFAPTKELPNNDVDL